MANYRSIRAQRWLLFGNHNAPYSDDLPDWERSTAKKRAKRSKRNRALRGTKYGHSICRQLTGAAFEARKRELEAR